MRAGLVVLVGRIWSARKVGIPNVVGAGVTVGMAAGGISPCRPANCQPIQPARTRTSARTRETNRNDLFMAGSGLGASRAIG